MTKLRAGRVPSSGHGVKAVHIVKNFTTKDLSGCPNENLGAAMHPLGPCPFAQARPSFLVMLTSVVTYPSFL